MKRSTIYYKNRLQGEKQSTFERKKNAGKRRGKDEQIGKAVVFTHLFKVHHSTELVPLLMQKLSSSMSRNNIKGLLSGHKVLVNDQMISQFNYPLAKDDEVKIAKKAVASLRRERQKKEVVAAYTMKNMVIYEDEDFLAINKPHGLLSVASDHDRDCAYAYANDYLREKEKTTRPFILHRIDKETSGVLVFAKNIQLHSKLRMHWNEDIRLREYYAIVKGHFLDKQGTLVAYLRENTNHLIYVTKDPRGKKAITHYEVMDENAQYSLLRVCIDTGRKNQIRVQLQACAHPVVGDDKYGDGDNPLGRLGLHASCLEFIHPESRKLIRITEPLPHEFQQFFGLKKK